MVTVNPAMEATHKTSLCESADQIVQKYHAYAKQNLPRLTALAAKVHRRHAYMYPALHQLLELVEAINSEMRVHILKQEQVLSPRLFAMGQAVQHGTRLQPTFSGTLDDPAWHMIDDHDEIGTLLRSIRSLTHNYKLSQDACKHYQALYQGLTNFEEDFLCQVHLKKQHPLSASF